MPTNRAGGIQPGLSGDALGDSPAPSLHLLYGELRALADTHFRRQPPSHLLQATALVHEAFLKLLASGLLSAEERAQLEAGMADQATRCRFLALASRAMRQVLIDHARSSGRLKRGRDSCVVPLAEDPPAPRSVPKEDLLAVNEALERLASIDPRCARVVELRFFGGMTIQETANVLEVSDWVVEDEWRAARAWLARRLADDQASPA